MSPEPALATELRRLRKGRGVHAWHIGSLVGPELRRLCSIATTDDDATVRAKLVGTLRPLAETLPQDLRLAVFAALALDPDVRHPVLRERLAWLAERIDRDERTARRRVDAALGRLAEQASPVDAEAANGWYVNTFDAVVRFDGRGCEVREQRTIVATRDGLDRILASISLPGHPGAGAAPRTDPQVTLTEGGSILRRERPSSSHFRFVIGLPKPLLPGDEHSYGLLIRVPPEHRMRSHYVFTPRLPCREFTLRVRFDPRHPPRALWLIDKVHIRMLDDGRQCGEAVDHNAEGEAKVSFKGLFPGQCYGLQWTPG
jgi:hypothetical protein